MITIKHSYGAELDWINSYAAQFNGNINGNFIEVPKNISTGVRYFLDTGEDAIIFYVNVVYQTEIQFIQSHFKKDFIGLYCNLSEGKTTKTSRNFSYDIGRFGYDFSIIDSLLETDYIASEGTQTFAVCIFIKKNRITSFAKKNHWFLQNMSKIMDPDQNTFIKFDRMAPESFQQLVSLKKLTIGGEIFNLQLIAAANIIMSNYLEQMLNDTIIIEKVNKEDLSSIISIQENLINTIEKPFPSIKSLARSAYMSESKFKILFSKITGTTPNAFFMAHKLLKAKELLQEQLSINEVCDELNFANYSYFIYKFRERFGLSPYAFIKKL